jgi:hypothetical protein
MGNSTQAPTQNANPKLSRCGKVRLYPRVPELLTEWISDGEVMKSLRNLDVRDCRGQLMFKIEVFNALQTRFGPSKFTSLKATLQNATPN